VWAWCGGGVTPTDSDESTQVSAKREILDRGVRLVTNRRLPPQPPMSGSAPLSKAEAMLRALRVRFRAESWHTVDIFRRLATEIGSDPGSRDAVQRLRSEAHRVHGTAGSFGFTRASTLAAAIEERAIAWIADADLERDRRAGVVEQFMQELEKSFAEEV
jgi:HPt (histidine-containing phosphotransfer) domain-containing protein